MAEYDIQPQEEIVFPCSKCPISIYLKIEERQFVDMTHDGLGRICDVFYNPSTGSYDFDPIENNQP